MERTSLQTVLEAKKQTLLKRKSVVGMLIDLAGTAVVAWLLLFFVFGYAVVDGNSMYPALRDGDVVMMYRLKRNYTADDIVVFRLDERRYVKRVVAHGGDVVNIDDESGYLIVNGSVMSEGILYPTEKNGSTLTYPYTVPDGCVFVLGDNREQSVDSRNFGAISTDDIVGKVMFVLRTRII